MGQANQVSIERWSLYKVKIHDRNYFGTYPSVLYGEVVSLDYTLLNHFELPFIES